MAHPECFCLLTHSELIIKKYLGLGVRNIFIYCKLSIIAPFIDIPMFNVTYLAMHKVQMQAGAISKLLYDLCICKRNNPLDKASGLSSHTDARTIQ